MGRLKRHRQVANGITQESIVAVVEHALLQASGTIAAIRKMATWPEGNMEFLGYGRYTH